MKVYSRGVEVSEKEYGEKRRVNRGLTVPLEHTTPRLQDNRIICLLLFRASDLD